MTPPAVLVLNSLLFKEIYLIYSVKCHRLSSKMSMIFFKFKIQLSLIFSNIWLVLVYNFTEISEVLRI